MAVLFPQLSLQPDPAVAHRNADLLVRHDPSVVNLFLQAFDEGWLTDGRGRRVYLSDSIVIMTSNIGSDRYRTLEKPLGFSSRDATVASVQADVKRDLGRLFSPEFLNRIDDVVLFSPLGRDETRQIALQYVSKIELTLARSGRTLQIDDDALELIVTRGSSLEFGARCLKRVIDHAVSLPISSRWHGASHFRVRASGAGVVVEAEQRTPAAVQSLELGGAA